MEYDVLWITSLIMTLLYCGLGGTVFFKYRTLLDPFQRATIIGFTVAFIVKTAFWIIAWEYNKYNLSVYSESDLNIRIVPIRTTLGALVSALSFIIYQIIILRIIVELD